MPSVGDFVSQGCFSDSIDSRALDNSFKDPAGMTVQECVEHAGSHKYAAVEFGRYRGQSAILKFTPTNME